MSPSPAFFALHGEMPHQGPGSADEVEWVLARIPPSARIVDAACGPGADTAALAEALPEAQEATARFGARAHAREGDLRLLEGPADLILHMGALYGLELETVLPLWRPTLTPGGHVAFSEPVLLSDPPSPAAAAFWREYPNVGTAKRVAARVASAGYRILDTKVLIGRPWAEYYGPLSARIARFRPSADAAFAEVLDAAEAEIALWRQAPEEIAYLLVLAATR